MHGTLLLSNGVGEKAVSRFSATADRGVASQPLLPYASEMPNLPRTRDRSRDFDVVLFGATGFTGRLVADYLVRNYLHRGGNQTGLRLALAGRNEEKLEAVAQEIGAPELPILIGDSFDGASLDAIASRAEVVITTVGPYAKYGHELVAACVRNATDYCDVTGEPNFVRDMIDRHHETARENGARIVHCCGWDSIPSDLGTLMVQEAMKKRHGTYASEVKMAAGETKGAASGGTAATMINMVDEIKANPSLRKVLGNPYGLNPEGVRGPDKGDQTGIRFDKDFDMWTAPFFMAATNTRIVRRSHALMGLPWGKDFRYSEVMSTGKGPKGFIRAATITGGLAGFFTLVAFPVTRPMIEKRLPGPGEGPDKEARERGFFKTRLIALGGGHEVRGLIEGFQDPGYGATAIMLSETALCLALDGAKLRSEGGVTTPAVAMGMRLIERLRDAGMKFEIQNQHDVVGETVVGDAGVERSRAVR
ncbi:MAG: saccharopine dehydrogenase NADP-binding domain-containing protein [Myxococcales bacterium]|nr:saccharopine dehydrogenase NADP-binding domain-containing protein [Myxococcales bacterium]